MYFLSKSLFFEDGLKKESYIYFKLLRNNKKGRFKKKLQSRISCKYVRH